MTDAVPGFWSPVSPWDPTVRLVSDAAAKQLIVPSAFVIHVFSAGGRVSINSEVSHGSVNYSSHGLLRVLFSYVVLH